MFRQLKSRSYYWLLVLVGTFSVSSCLSDYDLKNLEVEWAPEILVPLAHGNFVLNDIVDLIYDDSLYLKMDNDSMLHIFYRQDSVYYKRAKDLIEIPDNFDIAAKELVLGDIPVPDYSFDTRHTLRQLLTNEYEMEGAYVESLNGTQFIMEDYEGDLNTEFSLSNVAFEEIEYAVVSTANVEIIITNNYPVKITFTGELYDEKTDELVVKTLIEDVMPGETRTLIIPIEDKHLSSELTAKTSQAKVFGSEQPIIIELDASLEIDLTIKDIKLEEGKGITPELEISDREFISFELSEEYLVDEVLTGDTEFEIILSNTIPIGGKAVLTFPGFTKNDVPKSISIPFNANQQDTRFILDLSNYILNFTGESPSSTNSIEIIYTLLLDEASEPITLRNTDKLTIQLQVNKLELEYLEGFIGKRQLELNKGVAEFPSDFWEQIEGNVRFANPNIHFLIENSIGLPNEFTVNFIGINQESQKVSLNPPVFSVPYPTTLNRETKKAIVTVDKSNSNILDFIALPPDLAVEYNAFITLNPTETNEPHRIYPESYIKLGYEVEIPMQFSTTGIQFSKYFNLDSIKIEGLETGTLRIKYANHIPLTISMQTSFRDSVTNEVLNSLDPFIIKAAKTNDEGKAIESTIDYVDIELSEQFSESIEGANQLWVTGTLITPNEGLEEVKLYLNDYLDMKFILNAQFDIAGGLIDE